MCLFVVSSCVQILWSQDIYSILIVIDYSNMFFFITGPAVKFSESDTVLQSPPPTLGQHTDEVLKDLLGVEDDQLTGFRETGVIQ